MIWILGYIYGGIFILILAAYLDKSNERFDMPTAVQIVLIVLLFWPIVLLLILIRSIKELFKK